MCVDIGLYGNTVALYWPVLQKNITLSSQKPTTELTSSPSEKFLK